VIKIRDKMLTDVILDSDIEGLSRLISEDNELTHNDAVVGLSLLITRRFPGIGHISTENQFVMANVMFSSSRISNLLQRDDVNLIFDKLTTYGPSTILNLFLDIFTIIEKLDKSKVIWVLKNAYSIDALANNDSGWDLVEKDSSHIRRVLLSYPRILDMIDSENAFEILRGTISLRSNSNIFVLFDNQDFLDKLSSEQIRKCVDKIGLIQDQNAVSEILNNQKITKYLTQEDWNNCYRCAKIYGNEKLFEPYYTSSYFESFCEYLFG
jgi:hypothetical protein